jgi:hypothetical protein
MREEIKKARRAFLRLAEPYLDLLDEAREKLGFGVKPLCRDRLELLWKLEAVLGEDDPYGWLEFVSLKEAPSSPEERIPTAFRLPREKVVKVRVTLEVEPEDPPVVRFWLSYHEESGYEAAEALVRLTHHRLLEAKVDSDDFQGEGFLPRALWGRFLEEKWGDV